VPKEPPNKTKIVGEEDVEVVLRPGPAERGPEGPQDATVPDVVAVLPIRNAVIFPGIVLPLAVERPQAQRLLDAVLPQEKVLATVCQKQPDVADPKPEDLYNCGVAVMVLKLLPVPEGKQTIIMHGLARVRVEHWLTDQPFLRARISRLSDVVHTDAETQALMLGARELAGRIIGLSPEIPDEAAAVLSSIDEPGPLSDFLAANLRLEIPAKQKLLEELDVNVRLRQVSVELQRQLDLLELSQKIQVDVKANIDKSQRHYFLQEQMKAIQKELGETDEKTSEIADLREKVEGAGMVEVVKSEALRELGRLEKMPTISPEYHMIRTYLDWMIELPWSKSTEDRLEIDRARKILDEDHYDLDKVKRRILEYLAVRKLAPSSRGPILCFVGPPGVGKTSLGQSIARALGRKFIRMSLGGMRDEAELRGHRRTYIGALPGRIIQEIRKVATNNPVFMLDEVDKVGADFRGDPTSALLEVLDPAQNGTFQDHYLAVPFDLTKVMFITTANYMAPVPPALRDRMETIELPGYTQPQKLQIAIHYLVPRQLQENGLSASQAKWTEAGVNKIIDSYTREAGVRELERQIAAVCRSVAALVAEGKAKTRTITAALVAGALGPRLYESELAQRTSVPGVATALAFTPAGGEIIFVETAAFPGKGGLSLTGHIGNVMKESAQTALSLLKSHADEFGLTEQSLHQSDIHVHVPAGAVPKDGPSAGVAMLTALASLMTGRPARPDVAMTGEITLRGLVLPVGGIREKLLAAKRAGIRTVIIPDRNRKDMVNVSEDVKRELALKFVKRADEVLKIALGDRGWGKQRKRRGRRAKTKLRN